MSSLSWLFAWAKEKGYKDKSVKELLEFYKKENQGSDSNVALKTESTNNSSSTNHKDISRTDTHLIYKDKKFPLKADIKKQNKHYTNTKEYRAGKSIVTLDFSTVNNLIKEKAGSGVFEIVEINGVERVTVIVILIALKIFELDVVIASTYIGSTFIEFIGLFTIIVKFYFSEQDEGILKLISDMSLSLNNELINKKDNELYY